MAFSLVGYLFTYTQKVNKTIFNHFNELLTTETFKWLYRRFSIFYKPILLICYSFIWSYAQLEERKKKYNFDQYYQVFRLIDCCNLFPSFIKHSLLTHYFLWYSWCLNLLTIFIIH